MRAAHPKYVDSVKVSRPVCVYVYHESSVLLVGLMHRCVGSEMLSKPIEKAERPDTFSPPAYASDLLLVISLPNWIIPKHCVRRKKKKATKKADYAEVYLSPESVPLAAAVGTPSPAGPPPPGSQPFYRAATVEAESEEEEEEESEDEEPGDLDSGDLRSTGQILWIRALKLCMHIPTSTALCEELAGSVAISSSSFPPRHAALSLYTHPSMRALALSLSLSHTLPTVTL
ncbi:unnamed protein product [Dibothriocephalus latus]|uniref:Uncharacterized protein n=1 Tax=Dibothriocephalus latus TaxID=60516 RepID=A0A3P7MSB0_DIBLA|nr:unnamed protein product [Dibothriocephalus latus]